MDAQHILLVEDDLRLASLTKEYLQKFGYAVTHVVDGEAAVETITQTPPALVLLDLLLPKLDGFEVCKAVRPQFTGAIIMLTALDEDVDQIVGLEMGADDYITKPVEPRLLLARIKLHFRRIASTNQLTASEDCTAPPKSSEPQKAAKKLTFGELVINKASRETITPKGPLKLTTQEFDLLWLLASNMGEVLSRDTLYKELLGFEYNGLDRTIDILISRLRKLLQDNGQPSDLIKTVRNQGYLFIGSTDALSDKGSNK